LPQAQLSLVLPAHTRGEKNSDRSNLQLYNLQLPTLTTVWGPSTRLAHQMLSRGYAERENLWLQLARKFLPSMPQFWFFVFCELSETITLTSATRCLRAVVKIGHFSLIFHF